MPPWHLHASGVTHSPALVRANEWTARESMRGSSCQVRECVSDRGGIFEISKKMARHFFRPSCLSNAQIRRQLCANYTRQCAPLAWHCVPHCFIFATSTPCVCSSTHWHAHFRHSLRLSCETYWSLVKSGSVQSLWHALCHTPRRIDAHTLHIVSAIVCTWQAMSRHWHAQSRIIRQSPGIALHKAT